jgi:uncharacterized RDD family membrane protein YckC
VTQQQAAPPATTSPVAELERRFYAFALDRLLAWGLYVVVGVVAWQLLADRPGVVAAVVAAVMVATWLALAVMTGVSGSTPGKSAVGLRVVHDGTGTPIGVGPALVRSFVLAAASLPTFGIGLATLAWTAVEDRGRQRRGWHDHLVSSVVVDVRPVQELAESVDDSPRHVVNLTAMRLVPAPAPETPVFQAPPPLTRPTPDARPQPTTRPPAYPTRQVPAFAPDQAHGQAPLPPVGQAPPRHAGPQAPAQPVPPSAPPAAPVRRPAADDPGRTVVRGRPQPATPGPAPGPQWRVTFDDGHSFVVEGLVLVGRRPEPRPGEPVWHLVPLASVDMSVSKTHAQLVPAPDGALVVVDRGSTNGSTLTRQGVSRQLSPGKPATLLDGDTVAFGDRSMEVRRQA